MGRATRILFSFPARPVPVPANRSQRPPLRPFLGREGNQLTLGWRIHRALGDVCDPTLARRHQNPTSAPPLVNPHGTETVPWLPGHRWSRSAARRHQKAMSAPPYEPPTAQKPCRGYPVVVGEEAALADIKKRRLRHPHPGKSRPTSKRES